MVFYLSTQMRIESKYFKTKSEEISKFPDCICSLGNISPHRREEAKRMNRCHNSKRKMTKTCITGLLTPTTSPKNLLSSNCVNIVVMKVLKMMLQWKS